MGCRRAPGQGVFLDASQLELQADGLKHSTIIWCCGSNVVLQPGWRCTYRRCTACVNPWQLLAPSTLTCCERNAIITHGGWSARIHYTYITSESVCSPVTVISHQCSEKTHASILQV